MGSGPRSISRPGRARRRPGRRRPRRGRGRRRGGWRPCGRRGGRSPGRDGRIVADGREAAAGVRARQVHRQVARLDQPAAAGGGAEVAQCGRRTAGHGAGDLPIVAAGSRPALVPVQDLGREPASIGRRPTRAPAPAGRAGRRAGDSRRRRRPVLDGLGREGQATRPGSFQQEPPARCRPGRLDPHRQPPDQPADQPGRQARPLPRPVRAETATTAPASSRASSVCASSARASGARSRACRSSSTNRSRRAEAVAQVGPAAGSIRRLGAGRGELLGGEVRHGRLRMPRQPLGDQPAQQPRLAHPRRPVQHQGGQPVRSPRARAITPACASAFSGPTRNPSQGCWETGAGSIPAPLPRTPNRSEAVS